MTAVFVCFSFLFFFLITGTRKKKKKETTNVVMLYFYVFGVTLDDAFSLLELLAGV